MARRECPPLHYAMQLSADTSQAELEKLYRAAARQELLRSTPLNVGMFLRYAALFVLFPGMVCGFRVGLASMLAFAALLVGLMLGGWQEWAVMAVRVWLGVGVCVLGLVSVSTVRAALALYRLRMLPRPADAPAAHAPAPTATPLKLSPADAPRTHEATLRLDAPVPGIYALLLRVQSHGGCRLLTVGRRGSCCVQTAAEGNGLQALLLYRLDKGRHLLRWQLTLAQDEMPHADATQLNRP